MRFKISARKYRWINPEDVMTNHEFETELIQSQHDDKTGVDLIAGWRKSEPKTTEIAYYNYETATGLEVVVSKRVDGRWGMKLIDTDCERIVGIKMFPADSRDAAIAYARECVNDRPEPEFDRINHGPRFEHPGEHITN